MVTQRVGARLRAVNNGLSGPVDLSPSSPTPDIGSTTGEHGPPADLFGDALSRGGSGRGATDNNQVQPKLAKARPHVSAFVRTVQQAALNPNIDPVKLDRLLAFQERLASREAKVAFDAAFSTMQGQLPVIVEKGSLPDPTGQPGSTYALWEDINEGIKPVLCRFGFGLRFKISQDHNTIVVTAVLSHAAGHAEETTMRLPIDLGKGRNGTQAIGSSTSYGKRYTASALLNITSRGEDDDGRAALGTARISPEEVAELRDLILRVNSDERRLTNYLGVPDLEDLPPSLLEKARSVLGTKAGRP